MPISPQQYLDKLKTLQMKTLLVYARYDLTFPVDLSRALVNDCRALGIPSGCRYCRAGTTARALRHSSTWTARC